MPKRQGKDGWKTANNKELNSSTNPAAGISSQDALNDVSILYYIIKSPPTSGGGDLLFSLSPPPTSLVFALTQKSLLGLFLIGSMHIGPGEFAW